MFFLRFPFFSQGPQRPGFSSGLLWNGVLCVLVGIAIILAPELLAFFVASILLIIGISLLTAWWKLRKGASGQTHWSRWG